MFSKMFKRVKIIWHSNKAQEFQNKTLYIPVTNKKKFENHCTVHQVRLMVQVPRKTYFSTLQKNWTSLITQLTIKRENFWIITLPQEGLTYLQNSQEMRLQKSKTSKVSKKKQIILYQ